MLSPSVYTINVSGMGMSQSTVQVVPPEVDAEMVCNDTAYVTQTLSVLSDLSQPAVSISTASLLSFVDRRMSAAMQPYYNRLRSVLPIHAVASYLYETTGETVTAGDDANARSVMLPMLTNLDTVRILTILSTNGNPKQAWYTSTVHGFRVTLWKKYLDLLVLDYPPQIRLCTTDLGMVARFFAFKHNLREDAVSGVLRTLDPTTSLGEIDTHVRLLHPCGRTADNQAEWKERVRRQVDNTRRWRTTRACNDHTVETTA